MECLHYKTCGGCAFREMEINAYRKQKENTVRDLLEKTLGGLEEVWEDPIFLPDGTRRRAALAFEKKGKNFVCGFNENKSHMIEDIQQCNMLTPALNEALKELKTLLDKLCVPAVVKTKKGYIQQGMKRGDILILEVKNGLDIVLEADIEPNLDFRWDVADFMNAHENFVRFAFRKKHSSKAEPIVQKAKPFIQIEGFDVFIPAGEFLQPSEKGEQTLIELVKKYIGTVQGKVADLFCGIGTFSYALAKLEGVNVVAADVSQSLLDCFQKSLNANMIGNVKIQEKNLFLYPLTGEELADFNAVVIDPPRAGAKAQVYELARMPYHQRPQKIIMVSCYPATFARDAKILQEGGYSLKKITMVDQFVYSNHSELVGLFTNEK